MRYTLAPEVPLNQIGKMSESMPQGGDPFSVDGRNKEWRIQRYLRDGVDPARSSDITPGSLEVGSLLSMAGKGKRWKRSEILMGRAT